MSKAISAIWTSKGRSISTGPGRPERIRWNACWNAPGTCAGSSTVVASLVTGLAMAAMSTAWKSSLCSRAVGACPVMHRIRMESAAAEYSPVIMSVPAGHMVDGAALAQGGVEGIDRRAGHAEGVPHAFTLQDLYGGGDGLHPGHGKLLSVRWAVSCGPTAARPI